MAETRLTSAIASANAADCVDSQLARQYGSRDLCTRRNSGRSSSAGVNEIGGGECRTESSSLSGIPSFETPPNLDSSRNNSGAAAAADEERALAARCLAARAAGAEAAHAALMAAVRELEYAQV